MQISNTVTIEEACRDGTLLVRIAERLDGTAGLRGITGRPHSTAAAIFNIRQVLKLLQQKPSMPLDLLWSEVDIVEGVHAFYAKLFPSFEF